MHPEVGSEERSDICDNAPVVSPTFRKKSALQPTIATFFSVLDEQTTTAQTLPGTLFVLM
jgi:hypothetical protein